MTLKPSSAAGGTKWAVNCSNSSSLTWNWCSPLALRCRSRCLQIASGMSHELHHLDVPDAICKQRLRQRNASGEHPFQVSDEEFEQFTAHFVPPAADEGFNVIVHRP